MKKRTVLVFGFGLFLSACAGPGFLKPGATRPDFDRDWATCKPEPSIGAMALAGAGIVGCLPCTVAAAVINQRHLDESHRCMQGLGYSVSSTSSAYR